MTFACATSDCSSLTSSFASCFTSVFTLFGGGRAEDDEYPPPGLIVAGRCLTEDDFTAVGPGLNIGPSSDSELSEGSAVAGASAGAGDAMR